MSATEPDQDAVDDIRDIANTLKTMSTDMGHLVAVEARLFGLTALVMVRLCLMIVLLTVAGWLFAGAAAVLSLASLQVFSLTGALVTVALVNFVLAALACWRLRYVARDLIFGESRASVNTLLTHARSLLDP